MSNHPFTIEDYAKDRFEVLRDFFLRDSNHAKTWDELSDTQKSYFIRTQAPGSEQPGEFMTVPLAYEPPKDATTLDPMLPMLRHWKLLFYTMMAIGITMILAGVIGVIGVLRT